MLEIFDLRNNDSFPLTDGLPVEWRGIQLRGAAQLSGKREKGSVVFQDFVGRDHAVQFTILNFIGLVRCILRPPAFPTSVLLSYCCELNAEFHGADSFFLRSGQFSFLNRGTNYLVAECEANQVYQIVEFSWPHEKLNASIIPSSGLHRLFLQAARNKTSSVLTEPVFAGKPALGLAENLLHSPFDGSKNREYFESIARQFLMLTLFEVSNTLGEMQSAHVKLTRIQRDGVKAIVQLLMKDFNNEYSPGELARSLDMSDEKLEMAFKEETNTTIFAFHLDQRMKEAERLLLTTNFPLKEISYRVGYKWPQNFVKYFVKHFGYKPSTLRKK
jgi:AraC-like DNA-binding protein